MPISLRPARHTDYDFLWSLHKATMKNYVNTVWGWDEAFQKEYFAHHFSTEDTFIIEREKEVGVVKFQDGTDELYIEIIEIDPAVQDEGIGTSVLKTMISKANSQQKPVKLQVLKVNPAKHLYERLKFEVVSETETHFVMKRLT